MKINYAYIRKLVENKKDYQEIFSFRKIKFCLKDIEEFNPCKEGVERYLKIFKPEEVITWEEFANRYDKKSDVIWLYNNLRKN